MTYSTSAVSGFALGTPLSRNRCDSIHLKIADFVECLLNIEPTYELILKEGYDGLRSRFLDTLTFEEKIHFLFCRKCRGYFNESFDIIDEMACFNDCNDRWATPEPCVSPPPS